MRGRVSGEHDRPGPAGQRARACGRPGQLAAGIDSVKGVNRISEVVLARGEPGAVVLAAKVSAGSNRGGALEVPKATGTFKD